MTARSSHAVYRNRTPKIVVVGSGMGGLTAALEAAAAGADVSLFEKNAHFGGKIFAADINGKKIDMGPTVLTMRWVFDLIFKDVGLDFSSHAALIPAEVIARHAWADGTSLDLYCDQERSRAAVAAFSSSKEADGFVAFSQYAKRIYEHAYRTFMIADGPRLRDMAAVSGPKGLLAALRIDPFRTMTRALHSFFKDERLIQLFARYATYYGASPYRAPATLHLIAEVERQGVWLPKNGMTSLADAMVRAAEAFGAILHPNTGVLRIQLKNGRVSGVVLEDETFVPADAVIFNGDAAAIAAGGLGDGVLPAVRKRKPSDRSLSALVTGFVARTEGFPLSAHNVFFPDRAYRLEFEEIFKQRKLPSHPAVYIRAQDRDGGTTPVDEERIFTIINAPPFGDKGDRPSHTEIDRCIEAQATLFDRIGLKVTDRSETTRMTPMDFAERFPHTGGAIYGPLTHSPFAALRRESARTKLKGLYLAGGTIHPGAGVPMAALSGRQAARAVLSDLGLKEPCPLRDMPGGISTA